MLGLFDLSRHSISPDDFDFALFMPKPHDDQINQYIENPNEKTISFGAKGAMLHHFVPNGRARRR